MGKFTDKLTKRIKNQDPSQASGLEAVLEGMPIDLDETAGNLHTQLREAMHQAAWAQGQQVSLPQVNIFESFPAAFVVLVGALEDVRSLREDNRKLHAEIAELKHELVNVRTVLGGLQAQLNGDG